MIAGPLQILTATGLGRELVAGREGCLPKSSQKVHDSYYLLRSSGSPHQKMLIYPVCFESSNDVQVERGHFFPAIRNRLPS